MKIDDEMLVRWMAEAVDQALQGVADGQAPFAAAVYSGDGERVSLEHNQVRRLSDPSAHAEVMAIRRAVERVGQLELKGCWLVSTCEPCPMCAAAIVFAGIENVAFGTGVATAEAAGFRTLQQPCTDTFAQAPYRLRVRGPILQHRCDELLLSNPAPSAS